MSKLNNFLEGLYGKNANMDREGKKRTLYNNITTQEALRVIETILEIKSMANGGVELLKYLNNDDTLDKIERLNIQKILEL